MHSVLLPATIAGSIIPGFNCVPFSYLSTFFPLPLSLSSLQDLDSCASSYSELAKLKRLLFIAKHCPGLQEEALKLVLLTGCIHAMIAVSFVARAVPCLG